MTPSARAILTDLAQRMGGLFGPDLKTPYLAATAGMTAGVLMMVAEEADRTAHRLAEENRAIRTIFRDAAGLPVPAGLAERLRNLAAGDETDLRISSLQAANDALRGALIDLHAFVETQPDQAAKTIEAAIWAELAASTRRRAFASATF
ncbi:MAG TPA: hypothetical protein VHZ26_14060 [Caulobacteraceae bacterium]|jgi:hypothetical protein|nr:hypothetical protein [Caulobacteraceae bacterium]